ncbi:MAG: hypothetical protein FJ197_05690 [Gammaproteobacteria bacterium]|nr:hypothetical protein [Gammaproteobacteria bacterium]
MRSWTHYARWNPVISAGLAGVPSTDIARQRVINMLRADDPQLARAGASFAYDNYWSDRAVTDQG